MQWQKIRIFNANFIKILAAILMLIDHVGLLFFPRFPIFRYIGRISMPLFAFAVAEGCRYTKDKVKHFALIFGLAVACQLVYYFAMESLYICILVTFSFSIILIYALQNFKKQLFDGNSLQKTLLSGVLFLVLVYLTYRICQLIEIDYGIWGCLLPVFASIPDLRGIENKPKSISFIDCLPIRVLCFSIGLFFMVRAANFSEFSLYALLSLPILFLYNGEKGKWNTKYFFYLFYPLHLAALQIIYWCL